MFYLSFYKNKKDKLKLESVKSRYQVTDEQMALLRAEHILIERSNITLEDVIGQAHFGCVYRGKLYSPVLISIFETTGFLVHGH
jgi:hypothetical protein